MNRQINTEEQEQSKSIMILSLKLYYRDIAINIVWYWYKNIWIQ